MSSPKLLSLGREGCGADLWDSSPSAARRLQERSFLPWLSVLQSLVVFPAKERSVVSFSYSGWIWAAENPWVLQSFSLSLPIKRLNQPFPNPSL